MDICKGRAIIVVLYASEIRTFPSLALISPHVSPRSAVGTGYHFPRILLPLLFSDAVQILDRTDIRIYYTT